MSILGLLLLSYSTECFEGCNSCLRTNSCVNIIHHDIMYLTWPNVNLVIFQLADMERFHAQVVQRLQAELNEAREQSQMPKGSGKERLGPREERQIHTGNHIDLLQREGNEETGAKASAKNNGGVVRGNPIILSHGSMEAAVPVYIPLDNSIKVVG